MSIEQLIEVYSVGAEAMDDPATETEGYELMTMAETALANLGLDFDGTPLQRTYAGEADL